MRKQRIQPVAGRLLAGLVMLALAAPPRAAADDPLDDMDGTEGWDQVVEPQPSRDRDLEAERDAFKKEVADWEGIRQLWQVEREGYIREKTNQTTYSRKWKRRRQAAPPRQDVPVRPEEADWGDQSGDQWFESTTSDAIDEELGESGATAGTTPPAPLPPPPPPVDNVPGEASSLSPFRSGGSSAPSSAAQRRAAEEAARKEAEHRLREQRLVEKQEKERRRREAEEQRRRAEEERRRKAEEARRRKEAEAAAGEAAAAELLRQQEEQMRKEQEDLRKKADLETDEDGQVVDPDLAREIEEED